MINNTNIINLAKQEISKNEKKLNFINSIFDEVQESDLKVELETEIKKEKKLREKKKKNFENNLVDNDLSSRAQSRPPKPTLEEAQIYFLEKSFTEIEAQRFFNYFESNG